MVKKLSSTEVRDSFLEYFKRNGHEVVASSSLVPHLDPTLLFTNAGMNQFKSVFTGEERRDYRRAASSQKCVRAGGKHNDLENVGRTARHHTFFEMLGNFSFGDYFKKEAIAFAWEYVTKELKLPKDRLYVSVFTEDDEAFNLWRKDIGVKENRIYRFGAKDNFWAMGETGPCGPCSEIFFDQGKELSCGKPGCDVGCDCDRYVEFWNLVFMEFEQKADGTRERLPKPSIDTGMGLERVTAIVQGVPSNYDTDLFAPILSHLGRLCGVEYVSATENQQMSLRAVSDHIRSMTFLLSDGVLPSNEGRGYVLRRIMRRAMRHGRKLGLKTAFLGELSEIVVKTMGKHFTELPKNAPVVSSHIRREEDRFSETIDRGLGLLEEHIQDLKRKGGTVLPGRTAFRLYDTYGFPVDMTADILRDAGLHLDEEGFEEAFEQHREKARGSWRGSKDQDLENLCRKWSARGLQSEFLGYETTILEGTILALVQGGREVESANEGQEVEFLADRTPFYGESGGQVGDIGGIAGQGFSLEVVDTKKPSPNIILHKCRVNEGKVTKGSQAIFRVDQRARQATAKNHTATHLLHAALREHLGTHVAQKGSLVSPERLRFDFTHSEALKAEQIQAIEQSVNERIWVDDPVQKETMAFDQAMACGATALFDEKYGSSVRVVSVSEYSKELCGGTHLNRTGEIGIFKIVKEGSVAAGVRRVEAFTGYRALRYLQDLDHRMREVGVSLGTTVEGLGERIEKLLSRQKELEKQLRNQHAGGSSNMDLTEKVGPSGVRMISGELEDLDHRELRMLADRQLERVKSGLVALGSRREGKAFLILKVSKDLSSKLDAGKLIQPAAKLLGGSGGGRKDMAQAGGPNTEKLQAALAEILSQL